MPAAPAGGTHRFTRIREMAQEGAGRPMVDRLREANPVPADQRVAIPRTAATPEVRTDGRPPTKYDKIREMAKNGGMPARPVPHHPALTGDSPAIPAGENRMGMDIMNFEDPREGGDGRSTGYMYLPGYANDADGDPYVWQERPGGPWHVNSLPGDMPEQEARTPQELMAKVARLFGVHGTMEVSDERENVPRKMSSKRTLAPAKATGPKPVPDPPSTEMRERLANFTPDERERLRADVAELRASDSGATVAGAWRGAIESAERDRASGIGPYAGRAARVNAPAGTGLGRVAVGGTDADRRAARPRQEGESDRAYAIRTAPSREAAQRQLDGHQVAGLRAIARAENVVTASGDTKADLVTRLMRALYDRHADSQAVTDMVNRDRTPAPVVTPTAPRTNAPATSGPITPTMTGSQLIAARRALQAEQQGADTPSAPAPTEREAKLAAKRAELEAAQKRFQAAADYQAGGSSKKITFVRRMDWALARAGQARRDIERLEHEIKVLELPERSKTVSVNFDDIKPGGIIKRDGQLYRVVKVNAKSVKVEMPPGWDDVFKKDAKITEIHPPRG